jgi:pimeloyl-ACP methyl ester carboxylesterase
MNRRTAFAAIGSAALAACDVRRTVAHAFGRGEGCVDVRLPSTAGVRVVLGVMMSEHVAAPLRYALAIPEGSKRVDTVAYLLPGRGGSADGALNEAGMAAALAEHLRGGGFPFAIASIYAGESYFHRRTNGEDRFAAATFDLPLTVRHALGSELRCEAIMGQSMGGYGALLVAETYPHRYRAVAVAGPAIFPSYDDEQRSVGDAFDSPSDFAAHDVIAHAAALRHVPVHVAVGKRDPFLPGVRQFARALPSAQIDVRDGCHDDGFWRASAPALIAFVGHALG